MKAQGVTKAFPVVCVGGSAGGLDAYIRLLKHLPADMGVAFVIVNHLRTVATQLHEILPRFTEMPESAIASGCIDFILSPEGIAREIVRIAHAAAKTV
jgi:chemotaxis response regulator CheB